MHSVFKFICLQRTFQPCLRGGSRNASDSGSAQAVLQQHRDKCLTSGWCWSVLRDFMCDCLSYTVKSQISRNFLKFSVNPLSETLFLVHEYFSKAHPCQTINFKTSCSVKQNCFREQSPKIPGFAGASSETSMEPNSVLIINISTMC